MPVPQNSRYRGLPVYDAPGPDGVLRPTVAMRPAAPARTAYTHLVAGHESVESLAYRYFGSSAAWWRIADANPVAFPTDLRSGATLAIPDASDAGRVVRTRSF